MISELITPGFDHVLTTFLSEYSGNTEEYIEKQIKTHTHTNTGSWASLLENALKTVTSEKNWNLVHGLVLNNTGLKL